MSSSAAVAGEVIEVQVWRRGSPERADGLLHVRNVDGLRLREPVRDDAEAMEEVVIGPLRMTPLPEEPVGNEDVLERLELDDFVYAGDGGLPSS
jgi:hypothetical protein